MRDPRSRRIASSSKAARFCEAPFSAKKISPETSACGGKSRIIASEVKDFPEPDSPTNPRTSPGEIKRLRSRTAGRPTVFPARSAGPGNAMFRCRICNNEATAHGSRTTLHVAGDPLISKLGAQAAEWMSIPERLNRYTSRARVPNGIAIKATGDYAMRVMVIVKASKESEAGILPLRLRERIPAEKSR